jgi:hypothetical protein
MSSDSLRYCVISAGLALIAAACDHGAPFKPETPAPAPPFTSLFPRRLTFNLGDDRTPSWLPDGSGIIYSSEREDRPDHDRCLTILPAEGGTIRTRYCRVGPVHEDSTDVMESPAVSPTRANLLSCGGVSNRPAEIGHLHADVGIRG